MAEIYDTFPEQGDTGRPELVLFIDEAHLIFNEASKALLNQIESMFMCWTKKRRGAIYFVKLALRFVQVERAGGSVLVFLSTKCIYVRVLIKITPRV